jgi:glucose/arabinose dehydrogenase
MSACSAAVRFVGATAPAMTLALSACSSTENGVTPSDDASVDVSSVNTDADIADASDASSFVDVAPPSAGSFCALPGSVQWMGAGPTVVEGSGMTLPDLTWLRLPPGFCAHYFATVRHARQLRFAPGGELFVASPATRTLGGLPFSALGGIAALPDDDHDGLADDTHPFLLVPSVQGLLFANGLLYYQDDTTIRSVTYRAGDRDPSEASKVAGQLSAEVVKQAPEHWPKVMDMAMDGKIYVTNGGSQNDVCLTKMPTTGSIFELHADGTLTLVTNGLRNPIALRCEATHNVCLAAELSKDLSADEEGREKLVPIRGGDNWGHPCCATKGTPFVGTTYDDAPGTVPDCSGVSSEDGSFVIGHTPFGIDFEPGKWPAPWTGRVFVTLHGTSGNWSGARVVSMALDPNTGLPLAGSEVPGIPRGSLLDFATGWDDDKRDHGRPAPITFSPDGRLFLGDDWTGLIVWIAPFDLLRN